MVKSDRHKPGYIYGYQRETYDDIRIRVRKDSDIKNAIRIFAMRKNMSINEYVLDAIQNQLAFDGYIPGEEE